MNRIVLMITIVVVTSGCAARVSDARYETLMQRLERAERALEQERRSNLDLAMGRTPTAAVQPQPTPTAAPTPAPTSAPMPTPTPNMTAQSGGYARVASAAYVATSPPWQGQTDSALEVRVHVSTRRYAVGITVNGTVVPIGYGDAAFPTTLQVATPDGRLIPTPVVPPPADSVVRVLVPRVGQASLAITCYVVAAGTGQPAARWTREIRVPTTQGITVFDHTCDAHLIR